MHNCAGCGARVWVYDTIRGDSHACGICGSNTIVTAAPVMAVAQ